MQEIWVQSLSWEDPLEKEMATHSSIPTWEIPWTEEPGGILKDNKERTWEGREFFPKTLLITQHKFLSTYLYVNVSFL